MELGLFSEEGEIFAFRNSATEDEHSYLAVMVFKLEVAKHFSVSLKLILE